MTERQRTVAAKVTRIKLLHIVLMIVWPVVTAGLFFLTIHMREQMGIMTVFALLMVFMWGSYSYYILLGMRNDHLRSLAVDLCDFSAYLECMQFVQRFYINGRAALGQRVYLVDAYLMKGDFDSSYRLLMDLKPERDRMSSLTRMTYDYYWCKLYADMEDAYGFEQCTRFFRQTWIPGSGDRFSESSGGHPGFMQINAGMLDQELTFREMIFRGQLEKAREFLSKVWRTGQLRSRYEYVKYCYYMGRIEFGEANFPIAKHWFAQTVSFGIREHMSFYADQFLEKLDMAGVPYAPSAPSGNEVKGFRLERTHYPSAFASMVLGLFAILLMLLMH